MHLNLLTIIILISTIVLWKLDIIATLLNLGRFTIAIPDCLKNHYKPSHWAKTKLYLSTNYKMHILSSSVSLAAFLAFWALGGFGWVEYLLNDWTSSIQSEFWKDAGYNLGFVAVLSLLSSLISTPFSLLSTFGIEQRFGFNRTTIKTYILDMVKGLLLSIILGVPVLLGLIWILESVNYAWFWAWLFLTALQLILTYLAPVVIMPLFNKFTPMPEGELKTAIEALAIKADFPLTQVMVMDGSKRSSKANAFFTGFGKAKKIALFDTLIEKHSTEELIAILAHEIGHFKKKHIIKGMISGMIKSLIILYFLDLCTDVSSPVAEMLHQGFGMSEPKLISGLVFFSMLLSPIQAILSVWSNYGSRKHEYEADAYACQITGHPEYLISALSSLSSDQMSHPNPHALRIWLDYSHPPVAERIAAMENLHV